MSVGILIGLISIALTILGIGLGIGVPLAKAILRLSRRAESYITRHDRAQLDEKIAIMYQHLFSVRRAGREEADLLINRIKSDILAAQEMMANKPRIDQETRLRVAVERLREEAKQANIPNHDEIRL